MAIVFAKGPRQTAVATYRNLNLLGHAQIEELEIGSRCGGHGVCGGDRVRITDAQERTGLSPVTESEREHLSAEELREGWRLACQAFPNQDELALVVRVPEAASVEQPR